MKIRLMAMGLGLIALVGCGPNRGVDVGGGGSSVAGEFVQWGNDLVEILRAHPIAGVDNAALEGAVRRARITLNERELDARNYPSEQPPRIDVNPLRWERLRDLRHEKLFLVFHEYLAIAAIDDSDYRISRSLDSARVCSRSKPVRIALEKEFGRACYEVGAVELRQLGRLDLRGAKIDVLHSGDFDGLHFLKRLDLSENALSTLAMGLFRDLGSLETLGMRNNQLQILTSGAFEGLANLNTLDLTYNRVRSLETGALSGLLNVRSINGSEGEGVLLFGNPVSELAPGFLGNTRLQKLFLCDPVSPLFRLRVLSHGIFRGAENVVEASLCLALADEESADGSWSEGLRDLHFFEMQGRGLTHLPLGQLGSMPYLRELRLVCEDPISPSHLENWESLRQKGIAVSVSDR